MVAYDNLLRLQQILLQNATASLTQNLTKVYYKMLQLLYYNRRQFYCKMRQLLQGVFVTKCGSY